MSTNYRALCAEMLSGWQEGRDIAGPMNRARAALNAEPEGEEPSVEQMYYWALKSICQYGSDTLSGRADGGADDREWQRAAVAEIVRRAQEALDYGTPPAPPPLPPNYIDPEHTGQDRELLETFYRVARADGGTADECILRGIKAVLTARPATLIQQQAAELAALWGVPVAGVSDEHRDAVCTAIAESLGNAYDCQRVWSAWSYGTMGPDDFTLTAEDDDRVAEIADAVIEAFRTAQVPAPQAGEGEA